MKGVECLRVMLTVEGRFAVGDDETILETDASQSKGKDSVENSEAGRVGGEHDAKGKAERNYDLLGRDPAAPRFWNQAEDCKIDGSGGGKNDSLV